jgi:hypothetical protein
MKRKTIITLVIILAITAAISYGIIWYRNKKGSTGSPTDATGTTGAPTTASGSKGTGYALPKIETYGWWTNKLGHAKFPLGMSSRGVEVLKVQEVLNTMGADRGLATITEDGIWGFNTDARFKILFPRYSVVTLYQFITDFDPNGEILAKA